MTAEVLVGVPVNESSGLKADLTYFGPSQKSGQVTPLKI